MLASFQPKAKSKEFSIPIEALPNESQTPSLLHFLSIPFHFTFFSFSSPFRLSIQKDDRNSLSFCLITKEFFPQKVFCFLFTIFYFFWMVRMLQWSLPTQTLNPAMFIEMFGVAANEVQNLITIHLFWWKKQSFVKISEEILTISKNFPKSKVTSKFLVILICSAYLIIGVINLTGVPGAGRTPSSFKSWWNASMRSGRKIVYLSPPTEKNFIEKATGLDYILGVFAAIGLLQRRFLSVFTDMVILMNVLVLWHFARHFAKDLNKDMQKPQKVEHVDDSVDKKDLLQRKIERWKDIDSQFSGLQKLAGKINEAIGPNVTLFIVNSVLAYPIYTKMIFDLNNFDLRVAITFSVYYLSNIAILLFSADISNQMKTLERWLKTGNNRKGVVRNDDLFVVIRELDSKSVAIRGNDVYPITYSAVAEIYGATLTYFIICVQFPNNFIQ